MLRKTIRKAIVWLLLLLLVIICRYVYLSAPILTGYGAKNLCSAVFLQHRQAAEVIKNDLSDFPFSLVTYALNETDSSATASLWGFAGQKAIFRRNAGAALVNDYSEADIRKQKIALSLPPSINTDTLAWPYGDKLPDTLPSAIDTTLLQQAFNKQFSKDNQTRALLVVYDGQIVAEQYAPGFDMYTPLQGWSISKSITAALTGILVKQGKLDLNASGLLPQWQHSDKADITLRELLQQTSGIRYREDYSGPSEATTMLFKKGDMSGYIAGLPMEYTPGTVFNYSSGNANLLSRIIRNTIAPEDYYAFPYTSLLYPLGMYHTFLETDAGGMYVGSSYTYATARDFARFGLLYYQNGYWNGKELLPDHWVQASVQPSRADPLQHYGYFFWLNGWDKDHPDQRWFRDVPPDMFFASGYLGQGIYIIPSKKLVVVRLGQRNVDENRLLKDIITAVSHQIK
ncbi:MAG: serine hydrolase [Sphingobacteriales bacterium]|nr:serine hydrolase [Sphingobacteriales bacterium]OJY80966.1 MAG: hypothetical protein BGP14_01240 [Sphingobacteriales bacterium 44-15]